MKFRDVDLKRGRVRLDENKTDDPRAWALSPDVARTLKWWKKRRKAEDDDLVIGLDLSQGAHWLKGRPKAMVRATRSGHLRRAGITRAELFETRASHASRSACMIFERRS